MRSMRPWSTRMCTEDSHSRGRVVASDAISRSMRSCRLAEWAPRPLWSPYALPASFLHSSKHGGGVGGRGKRWGKDQMGLPVQAWCPSTCHPLEPPHLAHHSSIK
jgi:hypothetical protein